MEKYILVTGGLGYIGSHIVVTLEKAGYKTVIVDNAKNGNNKNLLGIKKILGYRPDFFDWDIRSKDYIEKIFLMRHISCVIHCAGLKASYDNQKNSLQYFQNDITGTINLIDLMEKYGVKKMLFSSSANIYSKNNQNPITEESSIGPSNPFGTCKMIQEQILKNVAKYNNFQVMSLRYFNPIGAHPTGTIGERVHGTPGTLFPYIFKVLQGELPILPIYGHDYTTPDNTARRDYIDVNDIATGFLKAYEKIKDIEGSGIFSVYNLGVGLSLSILELINSIEKVLQKKVPHKFHDKRDGDVQEIYCYPEKAKKELGFSAKVGLDESIKNTWKFYNSER